jgi:hypothetical protein
MKCSSRRFLLLVPVLLAALVAGTAPTSSAQCFGPDGLNNGPCCSVVTPNLPQFPSASLPGLAACWDRCTQGLQRPLKVSWNTPAQPACTEYVTGLTVTDAITGLPMMAGQMVLNYTRTWREIDPAGNSIQVWRFTAKADLSALSTALASVCAVPPCIAPLGPHPTAFFYGYVDYATCNVSGLWENVLVLSHAPDRFIHTPGFSDRPGVFHPGQSYTIIAPHSAVQPFVPGNNLAGGGPLFGEAVRPVNVPGIPPFVCMNEDPVKQGLMQPLGGACLANLVLNPKQHTLRQFQGVTSCATAAGLPGAWTSLNISFPALPWLHMVTTSVGTWTNPNVYPGVETAWVDEGLFVHQDACTGDFVELKYGGSTRGGWNAILPTPTGVVLTQFTDIADNYTAPLNGPYPFPIMGSIRPTEHLIYVNEP